MKMISCTDKEGGIRAYTNSDDDLNTTQTLKRMVRIYKQISPCDPLDPANTSEFDLWGNLGGNVNYDLSEHEPNFTCPASTNWFPFKRCQVINDVGEIVADYGSHVHNTFPPETEWALWSHLPPECHDAFNNATPYPVGRFPMQWGSGWKLKIFLPPLYETISDPEYEVPIPIHSIKNIKHIGIVITAGKVWGGSDIPPGESNAFVAFTFETNNEDAYIIEMDEFERILTEGLSYRPYGFNLTDVYLNGYDAPNVPEDNATWKYLPREGYLNFKNPHLLNICNGEESGDLIEGLSFGYFPDGFAFEYIE